MRPSASAASQSPTRRVAPIEALTSQDIDVCSSPDEFATLEADWNALALAARNPFLTHQWLHSWWQAFGDDGAFALLLRGGKTGLRAGAVLLSGSRRGLRAGANHYSDDWDVVAADGNVRRQIWSEIGSLAGDAVSLPGIPASSASATMVAEALAGLRYRVSVDEQQLSPYLALPETWDSLLAKQSRNHRSQLRRRRNRLEESGELVFRTETGPDLAADLDRFLTLEASGWKGEGGTAIRRDPAAVQLYESFAHRAAAKGWLRLHFLELDGVAIAADYSCVIGDAAFLLKTCFDERHAQLAPGTVLRGEAIRAAIEEDLSVYEFLGGPDAYKVRWGGELRPRLLVRGYRRTALPTYIYRHKLRPLAVRLARSLRPTLKNGSAS